MIEKILEKIEQLKVHKAILMLNKHPLCVDIVEMVSKQKVLEIVQEVAKDGGWIPCSSGQMPNECEEVDVTIEEIDGDVYTSTSWLQEGVWVVKKTALQPRVIAWKPKSVPYQKEQKKAFNEEKCKSRRIAAACADSYCSDDCDMQCPHEKGE